MLEASGREFEQARETWSNCGDVTQGHPRTTNLLPAAHAEEIPQHNGQFPLVHLDCDALNSASTFLRQRVNAG
jgi:hypothetical protein